MYPEFLTENVSISESNMVMNMIIIDAMAIMMNFFRIKISIALL